MERIGGTNPVLALASCVQYPTHDLQNHANLKGFRQCFSYGWLAGQARAKQPTPLEYIKNVCAHYNTKLFIVRRDEDSPLKLQVRDDLARDLFHYGRKTHTNIFERMKEKIENNEFFSGF